jgi:hypothetical protein
LPHGKSNKLCYFNGRKVSEEEYDRLTELSSFSLYC